MAAESTATGTRAVGLFVLAAVVLGLGVVGIKVGLGFFPPLLFAAFRIDIAAVLLLAYAALRFDDWRPRTRRDAVGILAGGAFLIGGMMGFLFLGLQDTTSGVAAIVLSLDPVLTVAFAALLLADERLTRIGLVGVLVALVGVGIVVQPSPADFLSGNLAGEEYVLLASVSLALGSVLVRWSNHDIAPTALTAWAMVVAAPMMHLASVGVGESFAAIDPTPTALGALFFVAVVAGAGGYALMFDLIEEIGAVRASFLQYAVPVVASLGGWLLLGERLPPEAFVGYLVIFAGFLLLNADGVRSAIGWVRSRAEPQR